MNHLMVVFKILNEHLLLSKYRICESWMRSVTFLGHIICSEGVEVYPRKTEAVKNWPRALTPTEITSFMGLSGLIVEVFASTACPLTTFTQK